MPHARVRVLPSVEEHVDLMMHASYCHVMNGERSTTTQLKSLLTIWSRVHTSPTQRRYPPKVFVSGTSSTDVVRQVLRGRWVNACVWTSVIG